MTTNLLKLANYIRVEHDLADLSLFSDYIAVREQLERSTTFGLSLPPLSHTTLGEVVAAGESARSAYDVHPGDLILYGEWQGGRWAFVDTKIDGGEVRVLVMRVSESVLAKVIPNEFD